MPLILRLALRDLRGGLRGFGIFLACIALGVAAITGVGSVSRALSDGLARQGRVIVGGDASFNLIQREATPQEAAFLASRGHVSEVSVLRAMARHGEGTALVELKAVGADYPTAGTLTLDPPIPLAQALAEQNGLHGIVAHPALKARLGLRLGDEVAIGTARYALRAVLTAEPDKLAGGLDIGPRVIMSDAGLAASSLIQPGSLVRRLYRVALPQAAPSRPADSKAVDALVEAANKAFPDAGWEVRTRKDVSPQFSRDLRRFTQFLTLVGLTALIIGGAGVANAIRGFVARKRPQIATLKSLGATGGRVFAIMLLEVMLIAAGGIVIGLAIGVAMPFVVEAAFAGVLPIQLAPSVYPAQIAAGVLYGAWTALAFSLGPLGQAHDVPVSALFRDRVEPDRRRPRARYLAMVALAGLGLVATILALSDERTLAMYYMIATASGFVLLRLVAWLLMAAARRMPHSRIVALRLAVANIHRPGALTPTVVLSLGLGLALLVALTLIDGNIRAQLNHTVPGETPSFFFVDLNHRQSDAFAGFLHGKAADGKLELVPMMRGRIVKVNGTPVSKVRPSDKAAWVLQGDRGITFSPTLPAGSTLVRGPWWPADYAGKPLVSLEEDIAKGLGLSIGDSLTVNVFGRDITATVANTRKVDWRKFGINFVLVYTPSTFAGAPYSDLASLTFPKASPASRDFVLLREVADAYPGVTIIRVKDALDAVSNVVAQLAAAIRGAAGVALAASVLVLAGALAAGQEARLYDAVVLKTLGATRARLLAAFLLEYGILGLATATFGVFAGMLAAWGIVSKVMGLDFVWLWPQALAAAAAALVFTVLLGLAGTWRVLGRKPAPYLRNL
ncbi:putative ABC transport system permease protein [Beijerinckiaceae bacterium RH AL1]|nr:putative ABC transport system permease protein [Beijerinckiaceae bacterium RH AL8]VVB42322.1 putative ABC transport system permease protein [Beijerinckiaceae bacterium RH CH11]VVC53249.1 putative ABC transport system permease protein [Beijerinckiaceae bacterium RH AL1]